MTKTRGELMLERRFGTAARRGNLGARELLNAIGLRPMPKKKKKAPIARLVGNQPNDEMPTLEDVGHFLRDVKKPKGWHPHNVRAEPIRVKKEPT